MSVIARDGEVVEGWTWAPGAPELFSCNVDVLTLRAIVQQECFATRCIAIASLKEGQMGRIFREHKLEIARQAKRIGLRMLGTDTYEYARGIGKKKIVRLYHKRSLYNDREALIKELMRIS